MKIPIMKCTKLMMIWKLWKVQSFSFYRSGNLMCHHQKMCLIVARISMKTFCFLFIFCCPYPFLTETEVLVSKLLFLFERKIHHIVQLSKRSSKLLLFLWKLPHSKYVKIIINMRIAIEKKKSLWTYFRKRKKKNKVLAKNMKYLEFKIGCLSCGQLNLSEIQFNSAFKRISYLNFSSLK